LLFTKSEKLESVMTSADSNDEYNNGNTTHADTRITLYLIQF